MRRFIELDLSRLNFDLFDNFFSNWHDSNWYPTGDGYSIDYILPGCKREDISLKRKDDILIIKVKRKDREKTYKLYLPDNPIDSISSKLEDGILTIKCELSKNSRHEYDIKIE